MKVKEIKNFLNNIENDNAEVYIAVDGYTYEVDFAISIANSTDNNYYPEGVNIIAKAD